MSEMEDSIAGDERGTPSKGKAVDTLVSKPKKKVRFALSAVEIIP